MNDLTILLDSGSSINLFSNDWLLKEVQGNRKKKKMNVSGVMCQQGTDCLEMELSDELKGIPLPTGEYYVNKKAKGIGNIISLALLTDDFTVEMNSSVSNAFYVYDHNNDYLVFSRCPYTNMYRLDVKESSEPRVEVNLLTVNDNQKEYSTLECARANRVRDLQHLLGCPSDLDLAHAIEHNVIGNNSYSRKDVRIATKIYGKDHIALRSKSVKRKSKLRR